VVEFAAYRREARLDIAQAFSISQLGEGHCQKLVPTGKALLLIITVIPAYTLLKLVTRKILHELRENSLAKVHPSLSAITAGAKEAPIPAMQPLPLSEKLQIEKSRKAT
jgi:hypothetical protein